MEGTTIHNERCFCDELSDAAKEFHNYVYTFNYKLKEYSVIIAGCMDEYNGTPHTAILNKVIGMLKEQDGEKLNDQHMRIIHSNMGGYPPRYFDDGNVVELVKKGGFHSYWIEHDKDSDFVKNNINNLIVV